MTVNLLKINLQITKRYVTCRDRLTMIGFFDSKQNYIHDQHKSICVSIFFYGKVGSELRTQVKWLMLFPPFGITLTHKLRSLSISEFANSHYHIIIFSNQGQGFLQYWTSSRTQCNIIMTIKFECDSKKLMHHRMHQKCSKIFQNTGSLIFKAHRLDMRIHQVPSKIYHTYKRN